MWSKTGKVRPPHQTDSLLGPGQTLEGKMRCDANLRIDGNFTGEIHGSGTVTVGEQGKVHASITAAEVIIAGAVFGDVTARRRLVLTSTGSLYGSATAGSLSVMEGGTLSGLVEMEEPPAPAGAGGSSEERVIAETAAVKNASKESSPAALAPTEPSSSELDERPDESGSPEIAVNSEHAESAEPVDPDEPEQGQVPA